MVGAGSCQLNAIRKLKQHGCEVVVADYKKDSPGKKLADISVLADAFDAEAIMKVAKDYLVDGVITVGTDQPVLTVSKVAEALDLPCWLSTQVALNVTNKRFMKEVFYQKKLPSVPYAVVGRHFSFEQIAHLRPPYVMKPLDSQGQRGVFKCSTYQELIQKHEKTFEFTREACILIESYYPNDEVTVSGFVHKKKVSIYTITDRLCFHPDDHLGVCVAHVGPSQHVDRYANDIVKLTHRICDAFEIEHGPIYFQFLIGDQGVLVNEIACRIGGAYEDVTIPYVTGVDILNLNIGLALSTNQMSNELDYTYTKDHKPFSVELFFCREGLIKELKPRTDILKMPFVLDVGYNVREGQVMTQIENASQRAGFAIVTGRDSANLTHNRQAFYDALEILDENGENLVIRKC